MEDKQKIDDINHLLFLIRDAKDPSYKEVREIDCRYNALINDRSFIKYDHNKDYYYYVGFDGYQAVEPIITSVVSSRDMLYLHQPDGWYFTEYQSPDDNLFYCSASRKWQKVKVEASHEDVRFAKLDVIIQILWKNDLLL